MPDMKYTMIPNSYHIIPFIGGHFGVK